MGVGAASAQVSGIAEEAVPSGFVVRCWRYLGRVRASGSTSELRLPSSLQKLPMLYEYGFVVGIDVISEWRVVPRAGRSRDFPSYPDRLRKDISSLCCVYASSFRRALVSETSSLRRLDSPELSRRVC